MIFFKKAINLIREIVEKLFWLYVIFVTFYETYNFVMGYTKYKDFNEFLAQDLFYAIVGFEVIIMALLRMAGESNMFVIYRIHIIVILGIGREMFLKHNIDSEIALALLLSMISLVIIYVITHKEDVMKIYDIINKKNSN